MASVSSEPFVIENVILSFPNLFVPKPFMRNGQPQGEPKYTCTAIYDQETANLIHQYAQQVAQQKYTNGEFNHESFGWPSVPTSMSKHYKDNPRLANMFYCNASASQEYPPQIVDANRQPVLDRGQIYAGVVCAMYVNVFTRPQPARNGEVGEGVGVGIRAVMKIADGEPLGGGGVDVDTAFANVAGGQPKQTFTPPGGMPVANAQPQQNFGQPQTPATNGMPAAPFDPNKPSFM